VKKGGDGQDIAAFRIFYFFLRKIMAKRGRDSETGKTGRKTPHHLGGGRPEAARGPVGAYGEPEAELDNRLCGQCPQTVRAWCTASRFCPSPLGNVTAVNDRSR